MPRSQAVARRNRSAREQLAWLLRFAGEDLDEWRPGDWLNAREELKERDLLRGVTGEPSEAALREMQASLCDFLDRIEKRRADDGGSGKGLDYRLPLSGTAIVAADPQDRLLRIAYVPAAKDLAPAILFRLADLLTRIELSRLRRCRECKRFFLATKRQLFDTPQCAARYHTRLFRKKNRRSQIAGSRRVRRTTS